MNFSFCSKFVVIFLFICGLNLWVTFVFVILFLNCAILFCRHFDVFTPLCQYIFNRGSFYFFSLLFSDLFQSCFYTSRWFDCWRGDLSISSFFDGTKNKKRIYVCLNNKQKVNYILGCNKQETKNITVNF